MSKPTTVLLDYELPCLAEILAWEHAHKFTLVVWVKPNVRELVYHGAPHTYVTMTPEEVVNSPTWTVFISPDLDLVKSWRAPQLKPPGAPTPSAPWRSSSNAIWLRPEGPEVDTWPACINAPSFDQRLKSRLLHELEVRDKL